MKTKHTLQFALVALLIVSLAFLVSGCSSSEPETPAEEEPAQAEEVESADGTDADGTEAEQPETAAEETTQEDAADMEESAAEEEAPVDAGSAQEYDTEFPLPEDVQNFTGGGDQINFATSLTLEEAIDFYRTALGDMGLTERTLNTAITETTFSMVFDGHENGKAVVVQGVDLGNGTTNINIRFEDV